MLKANLGFKNPYFLPGLPGRPRALLWVRAHGSRQVDKQEGSNADWF